VSPGVTYPLTYPPDQDMLVSRSPDARRGNAQEPRCSRALPWRAPREEHTFPTTLALHPDNGQVGAESTAVKHHPLRERGGPSLSPERDPIARCWKKRTVRRGAQVMVWTRTSSIGLPARLSLKTSPTCRHQRTTGYQQGCGLQGKHTGGCMGIGCMGSHTAR
jgi:hypothetical protein